MLWSCFLTSSSFFVSCFIFLFLSAFWYFSSFVTFVHHIRVYLFERVFGLALLDGTGREQIREGFIASLMLFYRKHLFIILVIILLFVLLVLLRFLYCSIELRFMFLEEERKGKGVVCFFFLFSCFRSRRPRGKTLSLSESTYQYSIFSHSLRRDWLPWKSAVFST